MVGTNALAPNADIAKVQEWLGHANIATTRLYDRRQNRPEEGSGQDLQHGGSRTQGSPLSAPAHQTLSTGQ